MSVSHIAIMALVPLALGVRPVAINYGRGPRLFEAGVLSVRAFPVAAYVTFFDTRDPSSGVEGAGPAIDTLPLWKHLGVLLLPNVLLLLSASFISGEHPLRALWYVWSRFVLSALSPLGSAQDDLASFFAFVDSAGFVGAFVWLLVVASSLALIPLATATGGDALLEILSGRRADHKLANRLRSWTMLANILMILSWAVAIGVFLWRTLVP